VAVRIEVLGAFSHGQTEISLAAFLLTLPSVLLFYGKQWLFPVSLSEFYDLPLRTSVDAGVLIPVAILSVLAAASWFCWRRLASPANVFALVWVGVLLLPALNFAVFPPGELVHDRYFYLPSVGAALLVSLAIQPFLQVLQKEVPTGLVFGLPKPVVLFLLMPLIPLSYSTAMASIRWFDDYTLFEHAYRVAPQNATVRNNYAVQLHSRGDTGTAITVLQDLVKERPDHFLANYNLGRMLYELNLIRPAKHHLEIAAKVDPNIPETYVQLGVLALRTGYPQEAERHLRRAVLLPPHRATTYFALGIVLARLGNCKEARSEFARALELNPQLTQAREQMNNCGKTSIGVSSSASPEVGSGRASPQPPLPEPDGRSR
jgi:Tfp pilus assembly protein PilF